MNILKIIELQNKKQKSYCFPKIILKAASNTSFIFLSQMTVSSAMFFHSPLRVAFFFISLVPLRLQIYVFFCFSLPLLSLSPSFLKTEQQTDKNNFESHIICYGSRLHTDHSLKIAAPGSLSLSSILLLS